MSSYLYLKSNCVFPRYIPPLLWGKSGHLQTALYGKLGRVSSPHPSGVRKFLPMQDGATATFDLFEPQGDHRTGGDTFTTQSNLTYLYIIISSCPFVIVFLLWRLCLCFVCGAAMFLFKCNNLLSGSRRSDSIFLFDQMTSPWWYALVSATIARSITSEPLWITPRRTATAVLCWTTWELFPTSSWPLRACLLTVRPTSWLTQECQGKINLLVRWNKGTIWVLRRCKTIYIYIYI